MTTTSFDHLLSRGQINKLHLKNRIVMAPMGTFSDNHDGSVSAQQLQYYETRAAGGVGLIMLEGQYITNKTDPWIDYVTTADTDLQMRSWAAIVEACHAHGAPVCLQLSCGLGRNAFPFTDAQMVSASEVPSFYFPDRLCRALSIEEVRDIVESYRRAAGRALVAEADAIEIHAHAGYMIDQFMTPIWNKRTDEYGGSFENRMRLVTEIYQAIRGVVGPDFPVLIRMAAVHDFDGGRTMEESVEIVQYLESLGMDGFDIDRGCYEDKQWIVPSIYTGLACMADDAAEIKKHISVPVLNAGTHTPETAEQYLAEGKLDFVMFGRPLIADPDLPNKLYEGRPDSIRPCVFCNQVCVGRLYENRVISCAINARAVFEGSYPMDKVATPKSVAVVGGGPAGMEAARVAAERGHSVTVYEKADRLGGQVVAAATPPFKSRLKAFIEWQMRQLDELGVTVKLTSDMTPDSPELAQADRVIIALGAEPIVPPIPGLENAVEVIDAHLNPDKVTGQRLVVIGGGLSGCDYALEQAMAGKDTTVLEMTDTVAAEALIDNRNPLLFKMRDHGVKQLTNHKVVEVTASSVIADTAEGRVEIPADAIVYAFGMRSLNDAAQTFADRYRRSTIVGDCDAVGQIAGAVRSGFFAAWQIQ